MGMARPLGILVFDASGGLVRCGRDVTELTGYTAADLITQEAWCQHLFPDAITQGIVTGAFAAMAAGIPTGEPRSFEFSLPYCTASGDLRQGQFSMVLTCQAGETPGALFIISLQDRPDDFGGPALRDQRDVVGQALGEIQAAQRGLMAILEESQARVLATTNRIRGDQEALSQQWDDLFQEAFALARVRDLVEAIRDSVEVAAEAARSDVRQADPDRPLVGVPVGRPVALPLGLSLEKLERFWILSTLQALHGNRSDCARHLDIALRTVRNKLSEYKSAGFKIPTSARGRRAKVAKGV